jgi:riboflavin kinase/FMN adenylyltransferase
MTVRVVSSPDQLNLSNVVISIGNFDGVHIGHQMLLSYMQQLADSLGCASVVITFFPPAKLFFSGGQYLTDEQEKIELLSAFAPTAIVMIPFDHGYASTPKTQFLEQLARLRPHTIIVGEDFRFGFRREGTLNDLSHLPERLEVFGMKRLNGEVVSSSRVRSHLAEGHMAEVNALLGYTYRASGIVTPGARRGRSIGFPTANVTVTPQKALPVGVFAVTVRTAAGTWQGMANVGPRPSFADRPPSLEVHLFEFSGDLYDQAVTVFFHHFIRAQRKFANLDDLKAQLIEDKVRALKLLASG